MQLVEARKRWRSVKDLFEMVSPYSIFWKNRMQTKSASTYKIAKLLAALNQRFKDFNKLIVN